MKHFLFLATVFVSFYAVGQETAQPGINFSKGTYIAGIYGSGGFNNSPLYKHPTWSLSPWAGYFVAPNLATGLRIAYGNDASRFKDGTAASSVMLEHDHRSLAPEIFVRYYVPYIKVKPFIQVSAGYNFQWGESENDSGRMEKVKASNAIGSIEGGIRFPVGKRISIDAAYNYRIFSTSALQDPNQKGKIRIGLSYRF